MSKIIESKIKKLQAIENQFDEAIKELNGTRFERKNTVEIEAVEPAKKGGKA